MKNSIVRGWLGRHWLVAVLLLVTPLPWVCTGPRARGDEPVVYRERFVRWRLGIFRRSTARPVFPVRSEWRVTSELQPAPVVAAVPGAEPAKQAQATAGVAKSLSEAGSIVRREA